ncbi:MAG: 2OG-Fe(II) oxygenase [Gammaproteobacteria bacterium]|jgi:predicted 2-oxoglutarate/Fe(II)-dependent dioxygenase YbiX
MDETELLDPWPGRITPDFLVSGPGEPPVTFYERYCGRATVLVFAPDAAALAALRALADSHQVVGILPREAVGDPGFPAVADDGRLAEACLGRRAGEAPVALVLRPTLTLEARLEAPTIQMIRAVLERIPAPTEQRLEGCAPVLVVPDVLPAPLCARLIAVHDADNFESGVWRPAGDKVALVPDPAVKQRRDHRLVDRELVEAVTAALEARLMPAIARAFHYPVTKLESYKVVAYDAATGGYFRPHRDNTTPDARHRRFALTLNLNTDYAGGELVFPEFGAGLYRPPAGGALVFSGTLLHAAREVTAGRRYVLLTFLWGDEVEA